jgi:hypothetical protein
VGVRLSIAVLGIALVVLLVAKFPTALRPKRARSSLPKATPPPGQLRSRPRGSNRYEWERRSSQAYRAWKQVPGPEEDREGLLAFIESRPGVEAYVEPRTVMHPLSVVLVAGDGQWVRFQLRDDSFLREMAKSRGLRVIDASRFGYPERMRRRRPGDDPSAKS